MNTKGCVSLAVAKRLKAAGWQKETEFSWIHDQDGWFPSYFPDKTDPIPCRNFHEPDCVIPTPTPTELGEVLPAEIEDDGENVFLEIHKTSEWIVAYRIIGDKEWYMVQYEDTLADAMGEMVIYLLDKGIIKAVDIGTD